jgi:hypothetical protein
MADPTTEISFDEVVAWAKKNSVKRDGVVYLNRKALAELVERHKEAVGAESARRGPRTFYEAKVMASADPEIQALFAEPPAVAETLIPDTEVSADEHE